MSVLLGRSGDTIPASAVVLAQPADDVGPDPFAESAADGQGRQPIRVREGTLSGETPGLYGGTGTNACNAHAMADFLMARPTLAAAWAAALDIPADQVRSFLDELTPVTLLTDTAVTNHGFRDDRAIPFQAVLQAGTAVLIDTYGARGSGAPAATPSEDRNSGPECPMRDRAGRGSRPRRSR